MSASIHINGTQSSVLDSIFVCRTTGTIRASQFKATPEAIKQTLLTDLENLQRAGLTPTTGDARCLLFGHLARLAVWQLRSSWRSDLSVTAQLAQVKTALQRIYPLDLLNRMAAEAASSLSDAGWLPLLHAEEKQVLYDVEDQTPF
jgi:hypothetical protein